MSILFNSGDFPLCNSVTSVVGKRLEPQRSQCFTEEPHSLTRAAHSLLSFLLAISLCATSLPAQQREYVFRSRAEIVLVNVTVRDHDGNFVRDLKPEDFTVLEDNKPQKVLSFDLENTDTVPTTDVAQVKVLGNVATTTAPD